MRVAMLISQFPPSVGGTERQAHGLSRELVRLGIGVDVITQRYRPDLPAFETIDGVAVHRLGRPGTSLWASLIFFIHGFFTLARMRPRPDILHAHMISAPSVLALIAGHWIHRKSIVKAACAGPYGDVATSRRTWYGKIKLSQVLKGVDRIVCLTPEIEKEILQAGAPAPKLTSIVNGVDAQRFHPIASVEEKKAARAAHELPAGQWILFAGRMTSQKRPGVLLDAFLRIQNELSDAYLLFLGDGPAKHSLQDKVRSEGLASRVLFMGNQTNMESFYHAVDVFALPSAAEGQSNSLLEAMACGLPCITSDQGSAGLVEEGKTGRLVPLDDPEHLARALRDILQNPALAVSLGLTAREKIQQHYRLEIVAKQYASLYQDLAGKAA
jgi:glycosyltransferase involved in cell wall biosynthesis